MKKIILALLWVSLISSSVFAVDNINIVNENIDSIKSDIKETNTTLPKEDIDYLLAFFDEVKAELNN